MVTLIQDVIVLLMFLSSVFVFVELHQLNCKLISSSNFVHSRNYDLDSYDNNNMNGLLQYKRSYLKTM